MSELISDIDQQYGIAGSAGFILFLVLIGSLLYHLVFLVLRLRFIATYTKAPPLLRKYIYYPGLFFFILIGLSFGAPVAKHYLITEAISVIWHIYNILLILTITVLSLRVIAVIREVVLSYYNLEVNNNLESRKVVTQLRVIERIITFIIVITAIALILMTFKTIRDIGISLLASAGVIGIVIGFAAQKSIANVVAGIQLAFAQPIRIDDVVIVEGEWGRIEEITLTYVVVKIWDERRLVVPLNHFIEKPFQNWTRQSSDLIGSVFIYTDYTAPIQAIRDELDRLLEEHPLWDKRVKVVQVTDAMESTIQVRILISAKNSSHAFDLRCDIREGLITFLQQNFPNSLPRTRIQISEQTK